MPRANIDLGWLAQLLTPTPTGEANPNFMTPEQAELAKQFGGTGVMAPGTKPLLSPTNWQRMMHSDESAMVDRANLQYNVAPMFAKQADTTRRDIAGGNFNRIAPPLRPANLTTEQAVAAGYGTGQTPVELNTQNRAVLNAFGGLPATESATDISTGKFQLEQANRAVARQPKIEATLDQNTANELARATGVSADRVELENKLAREELGYYPDRAVLRERILRNQSDEQGRIVPAQQEAQYQDALLQGKIGSERNVLFPFTARQMGNEAKIGAETSSRLPAIPPITARLNPEGLIAPPSADPLGVSKIAQEMQAAKALTGQQGQEIKSKSGKSYTIPLAPPAPIDPLTGTPVIAPSPSTARKPLGSIITDDNSIWNNTQINKMYESSAAESTARSRLGAITNQLADPDLDARADLYPKFKAQRDALLAEKAAIEKQFPGIKPPAERKPLGAVIARTLIGL